MDANLRVSLRFSRPFTNKERADVKELVEDSGLTIENENDYVEKAFGGPEVHKLFVDYILPRIEDKAFDVGLTLFGTIVVGLWKKLRNRFKGKDLRQIIVLSPGGKRAITFWETSKDTEAATLAIPDAARQAFRNKKLGDRYWHEGQWKTQAEIKS